MDKDLGKIRKGEYQGTITDIVVGIKEYNGRVGVDIREFTTSEQYTGPTKKGLRIPAESFEEFKAMINGITSDDLKAPGQTALPEGGSQSQQTTSSDMSDVDEADLM